jgi:tetratricopeptide (TPR) repeat protein
MEQTLLQIIRRNLQQALRQGDWKGAQPLLERLKREDPLSVQTRTLELEALVRQKRNREAHQLAQQLVRTFAASPRLVFWAGRAAYVNRDYRWAVELFRESGRLAPHPEVELWLAKSLTNRGELDEAEPILTRLSDRSPRCLLDLAWLYERREDWPRAVAATESFLEAFPDNRFAQQKVVKLRAHLVEPDELLEEIDELLELDEDLPPHLMPQYLDTLLTTGRTVEARTWVANLLAKVEPRLAAELGWVAHRRGAADLCCELFLVALGQQLGNVKFLNTLQSAARHAGCLPELIEAYRQQAPQHQQLHGRIKKLERWLAQHHGPSES